MDSKHFENTKSSLFFFSYFVQYLVCGSRLSYTPTLQTLTGSRFDKMNDVISHDLRRAVEGLRVVQ